MELYVKHTMSNDDLTKQDIDNLILLEDYLENYRLSHPITEIFLIPELF